MPKRADEMGDAQSSAQSPIEAQAEAWKELALLTLEAVATHAVRCGEENDTASFSGQVREMVEGLRAEPDTAQILVAAGSVAQRYASYNAQIQQSILALSESVARAAEPGVTSAPPGAAVGPKEGPAPTVELPQMNEASTAAIATTIITCVASHLSEWGQDPAGSASLGALQSKLEKIVGGAVLGNADGAVSMGLADLLQNVETTFKKNHQLIMMLQERVSLLKPVPSASRRSPAAADGRPTDACTGLPLRGEAEAVFRQALASDSGGHVVVFYLHRMQLTNARFGSSVGDQVIFYCSQKIATDLITGANDQLFRWTGPAFVALVGHLESEADVRSEVQRLVSSPLSRYFETATRSVFLPVKLSAEVYPLRNTTSEALVEKLELFLLNSSGAPHS